MKTSLVLLLFIPLTAAGGLRDSEDFSLTTESGAPGQPRCASARFTNDMASDGMAGISQTSGAAGQPVFTAKFGYAAQLYDAAGISLIATPNPAPESATTQLTAAASADDGTGLNLAGAASGWQILSGPVTSINASGRASTAPVRRNEQASVRATVAGQTVNGSFIVADTLTDNFGPTAGDGLADRWQFRHFDANDDGILENPALAAPGADPDSDGLTNFTEAAFGLLPRVASGTPFTGRYDSDEGTLLLWWTRPVDTLGIVVEPQWSAEVSAWYASGAGPAGGSTNTFAMLLLGTEPGPDGAPLQLWQAALSPSIEADRLFARLFVR